MMAAEPRYSEFTKILQVTLNYCLKANNYYIENTYNLFRFYRFGFIIPIWHTNNRYPYFSQKNTLQDRILNLCKVNCFSTNFPCDCKLFGNKVTNYRNVTLLLGGNVKHQISEPFFQNLETNSSEHVTSDSSYHKNEFLSLGDLLATRFPWVSIFQNWS